jgi:hypothetical protein
MNTWFRKVGMGALALTLAGVLGGCNDGDGGGGLLRLFFGINGQGNCTQVIVDVNLDDADAEISRDEFGDVQCVINTVLENAGCDITFTEQENGDLRAVISGCTIPAISNLFSCLFDDVDISDLEETASAQCSCTTENCDGNPPVCISLDPDPDSCEDCDNGIDDDDNGFEDCEDPNCSNSPQCSITSTTSTTSTTNTIDTTTTTNTTSTTVSSTTSTTLDGGNDVTCRLLFRLTDDVTLGSLQWDTDYGNAPGTMLGQGSQVECDSLVPESISSFNDCDTANCTFFPAKEDTLISGIVAVEGFSGPLNLSECTFTGSIAPEASDFTVTVTEASDVNLDPVADVSVEIFDIECDTVSTTTSSTTTTTGGEITTTTEVGPTTTTTLGDGPQNFIITFHLDSATGDNVGALQWSTDYSAANGGIEGKGAVSSCANKVPESLFAENDKDLVCSIDNDKVCTTNTDCTGGQGECTLELEVVTLGVVSTEGVNAPLDLATCTFNGFASDPPVSGDFVVTIEDSTDANGDPITAVIGVVVTPAP